MLGLLPDATLLLDVGGKILEANAGAHRLLGSEPPRLVGTLLESLVASPLESFRRYLAACWRTGALIPGAATLRAGSENTRVRLSAGVLGPPGTSGAALLVRLQAAQASPFALLTEKVNALSSENAQRRMAEARLQSTVDGLPVAVCVRDAQGRFVLTNETFRRWFRPMRAAPRGLLPAEVLEPEAVAVVEADESRTPVEHVLGSGEEARHVLVQRFEAGVQDGERLVGWVWIDVSAQRRAEKDREEMFASVLHAQKLESLGVLAGGIAHDFNNLLVPILGNADMAAAEVGAASPAAGYLRDVSTAARRAADLCKQLLAYSGKGRFVVGTVDINEVVRETSGLLEVSTGRNATLSWDLDPTAAKVKVDVTQFRQILMNLITNASDAIGEHAGVIKIATGTEYCSESFLASMDVPPEPVPGLYTWVEVSDTGSGMDSETRARMFDPFFTTKFTGRGLGLAAVLGIVKGHGAALRVESQPGKGTSFKVFFPATDAAEEPAVATRRPARKAPLHGTVLVVDDERGVRGFAQRLLSRAGFEVLLAADGEEALRVVRERSDICLVLLDMTMPRMSGEVAFEELRALRPDLRVILSSGYDEQDATSRFVGKGLAAFIAKPYDPDEFIETVRSVLDK